MNEHLFHFYSTRNINEGIHAVNARVKNILHGEQNIGDNHIFKLIKLIVFLHLIYFLD